VVVGDREGVREVPLEEVRGGSVERVGKVETDSEGEYIVIFQTALPIIRSLTPCSQPED
jgi:hypothetical protein